MTEHNEVATWIRYLAWRQQYKIDSSGIVEFICPAAGHSKQHFYLHVGQH